MWCDLQQGNRDRLPGKETKLFPYLCHQPHCHYYSLNQHFGSMLRGDKTFVFVHIRGYLNETGECHFPAAIDTEATEIYEHCFQTQTSEMRNPKP